MRIAPRTMFLGTIGLIGFMLILSLLPANKDQAIIDPLFAQTNNEKVERRKFFTHNETFEQPFVVSIPKIDNDINVEIRLSISNIEITKALLTSIPEGFELTSDRESGIAAGQDGYNMTWQGTIPKGDSGKQLAFSAAITTGDEGGQVVSQVKATLRDISQEQEFDSKPLEFGLAVVGTAEIKLKAVANKSKDGKSFEKFVEFPQATQDENQPPQQEPKIFPGAQLRYEITWKSGVNFPIKLEDHLLIARLNKKTVEEKVVEGDNNPTFNTERGSVEWKLKDIFGEEAPANAEKTLSYTVQLKDEIDFDINQIGTEPYTYEPTETGAKYQGPLLVKDLWSEVFVELINYHGNPVENVFVDVLKADSNESAIESEDLNQHISDEVDGTFQAAVKRKNNISSKGELRFGVAFANSNIGMGFRTGAFLAADILNLRTKKIEIKKSRTSNFALKFGTQGQATANNATAINPADWEFPDAGKQAQYHKQTQMASVIWSNYVKAKSAMNDIAGLKESETLSVNFLPPSANAFSYVQNEAIYLSHKAWEPRSSSRYSPHTELHEFSHWLLQKKGVDRIEGVAPPKTEFPMDVPLYRQAYEPGNCGDCAFAMARDYLRILGGLEPLHDGGEQAVCVERGNDQYNLNAVIPEEFRSYKLHSGPPDFAKIDSSLEKGAPVIFYSTLSAGAGYHVIVLTGYDPNSPANNRTYYINDPNHMSQPDPSQRKANATSIITFEGVLPTTREVLASHWQYPESQGGPGFTYYDGDPINGSGIGEFRGLDSAAYGYANASSNHSLIEGLAIHMALEIEKIVFKTSTTRYADEQNKTLYDLSFYNPSFVTFGKSNAQKADSQGEGWVAASLLYSFANGLPKPASSQTVGWLNSKELKPYSIPDKSFGFSGLMELILNWKEEERTIAGLRHLLSGQSKKVSIQNQKNETLATTDIDLRFGLYGFFPDRNGNWILDPVDFSRVQTAIKSAANPNPFNYLLGSSASSQVVEKKVADIEYPEVGSSAQYDFEPLPSKSLGKIGQPFTKKNETINSTARKTQGTIDFRLGPRVDRKEPLGLAGSQVLVNANTIEEIGVIVDIVVNDPNNDLSYTDESTIVPGQPWNLHLPYPTVGSVAVVRFKNSADWLVIDSDQYWLLVGSDTPPEILAEKNVVLSGKTPSLNSVLAAAGYSADGRKVGVEPEPSDEEDDEIKLSPKPEEPAELPDEEPAPQGEASKPEPEISIIENIIDQETGEENLVKVNSSQKSVAPGESVRVRVAGLQGPTAKVLLDGNEISEFPVTGDAQQISIPISQNTGSGEHKVQVTDSQGTTLEMPVQVQNLTLRSILITIGLVILILIFVYIYLRIIKLVKTKQSGKSQPKSRPNNLVSHNKSAKSNNQGVDKAVDEDSESFFDATKVKPQDLDYKNKKDK